MASIPRWGRSGSWPPCPECDYQAWSMSNRGAGGSRTGYVECRKCGAIYKRPICPDCKNPRRMSVACRHCSSRKHPVHTKGVRR